jgi:hypothetical protein
VLLLLNLSVCGCFFVSRSLILVPSLCISLQSKQEKSADGAVRRNTLCLKQKRRRRLTRVLLRAFLGKGREKRPLRDRGEEKKEEIVSACVRHPCAKEKIKWRFFNCAPRIRVVWVRV